MSKEPAAGTGTLNGQTVTSPIMLPAGTNTLFDNETDASITASGDGTNNITEWAPGATISLQNGNARIEDEAAGATVTVGNGVQYDGFQGDNTVTMGSTPGPTNGSQVPVSALFFNKGNNSATVGGGDWDLTVAGQNNVVSLGDGNDYVALVPVHDNNGTVRITSDVVSLGNGSNIVLLTEASGNTIWDGSGTDLIKGAISGNEDFVINAAGGTQTIEGFNTTDDDTINLTQFLPNSAKHDLGHWISVSAGTGTHGSTTTVLTMHSPSGATDSLTLVGDGALSLSELRSSILV